MMRSNLPTRIGLTAVAVASALAITAPAANAEPVSSNLTCVFNGVAGNLNPPIPYPTVAVPPAGYEQDGLYTFRGGATCVGADVDVAVPPTVTLVGPVAAHIESNGYYSNLVVGTGDVAGSACVSAPSAEIGNASCTASDTTPNAITDLVDYFSFGAAPVGNTRVGYGIDFVNGTGTLGGGAYGPEVETGQTAPDAYNVVGAVQLLPDQLPPAPAVSSFTVVGAFTAETP